jgi:aspartate aminotransferase
MINQYTQRNEEETKKKMKHLEPHLRETNQSETLVVNEQSQIKENQGNLIYKFGFGQSPFHPPTHIINVVKQHAHRKEYMAVQGHLKLREAVAAFHHAIDQIDISADRVIIAPGSKILIFSIMACFKTADIFLLTPSWVSYEPQAKLAGHPVTRIHTSYNDRWRLTPELLESACHSRQDKQRPIIMVLNYPGNPDGLTYTESELKAIADVARRHHILIISDEIYGLLNYNGDHRSLARYYPEGTIVTSGLSKWCGAGGWRLGVALLPKSLESSLKPCLIGVGSETYSCVTCAIQEAAVSAYKNTPQMQDYLAHQRRILSLAGQYVYQTLHHAGVRVHPPQGGFYVNPDFTPYTRSLAAKGISTSEELCSQLLQDTGVVLLPGPAFGYAPDQLVTRLAFVDFEGKQALAASEEWGLDQPLTDSFLTQYMHKIGDGIDKLIDWLPKND